MSEDFYIKYIVPHKGIIIKLCRAYTDTEFDFEDYFQEVCLQIWKSRHNFKEQSKWSTWVYRITLNVCMTMLKKQKKHTGASEIVQNDLSIESEAFNNEELQLLYNAIRQLPEVDKAIIVLYLEDNSYREIADVSGMKTSAVGARINRIKTKLKTIIYGK
ncbi:RNA polymerase sigma-70 factor, ECF subfamily [Zunongwangia mangrovi]|uniref:RNA polymerase sigma-70 factor, ECF subfamily n=1 Tax=Zunongwangia mangrovi TaxID=1334022 RepID=A0A1I1GBQ2_9FLAO|nr:sigma-70 family RNA polymerase sigma factor [Zunongwangia mangrovi]SFC08846.1 RNA polymerase sigma-70 factor, ECF subfamily [Zunongwangia mangrovi]